MSPSKRSAAAIALFERKRRPILPAPQALLTIRLWKSYFPSGARDCAKGEYDALRAERRDNCAEICSN